MKYYQLMILIPFLVACTSKNPGMEQLEANARNYNDLSNTAYLLNENEIAYFTLENKRIKIQLINKDRFSENKIVDCRVNNKHFPISEDSSKNWDNTYVIELDKAMKDAIIECKLGDGTAIKQTIHTY